MAAPPAVSVTIYGFRGAPLLPGPEAGITNPRMANSEDNHLDFDLADETATRALAARVAAASGAGDTICLDGDLGRGKTVFARAFVHAFTGVFEEVPSPTFTLVQTYDGGAAPVHHFDLYRLKSSDELDELGIDEALSGGVTLVEWPDRLGPWLPANRLEIRLTQGPRADARRARLTGHGYWQARLIAGMGEGAMHA